MIFPFISILFHLKICISLETVPFGILGFFTMNKEQREECFFFKLEYYLKNHNIIRMWATFHVKSKENQLSRWRYYLL